MELKDIVKQVNTYYTKNGNINILGIFINNNNVYFAYDVEKYEIKDDSHKDNDVSDSIKITLKEN